MPDQTKSNGTLQVGHVTLDEEKGVVTSLNGTYSLTPMECRLLKVFMEHPGEVVPRKELMKAVWETDWIGDCRTLEVHICWLRKKIEKVPRRPRYLRTVRGVGYKFAFE